MTVKEVHFTSMLNGENAHYVQLAVFGYALGGKAIIEHSAAVCERRRGDIETSRNWDRTERSLAGELISHGGEGYRRVKDWAALPWVTEHIIRGHADYPGL